MRILILFFLISINIFGQKNIADSLYHQAISFVDLNDFAKANKLFQKSESLYLKEKLYDDYAASIYQRAILLTEKDEYSASIKLLNSAITYSKYLQDTSMIKLYGEFNRVYKLSKNDSAAIFSNKIEKLISQKPTLKTQNCCYSFYRITAYYANAEGDFDKARKYAKLLIEVSKNRPESSKGSMYNLLGNVYKNTKDYPKAIEMFEKAAFVNPSIQQKAHNFRMIVLCLHEQKMTFGVEKYITLATQNRNHYVKISKSIDYDLDYYLKTSEATQFTLLKKFDLAEKKYLEVLELLNLNFKEKRPAFWVDTYIDLSKVKFQQNSILKAHFYAQEALKAANSTFIDNDFSKNPKPVGAYYQKYQIKALINKAQLFVKSYPKKNTTDWLEIGINAYLAAFESVNYLRKTYEEEGAKVFLNEEIYPNFQNAVEAISEIEKKSFAVEKNIELQQYFQSNILLDELKVSVIKPKLIDEETLKKEQEINKTITSLEIQLSKNQKNDSIRKELNIKKIDLDFLRNQIKQKSPKFYAAKFENQPLKLSDIQKTLQNDVVLLNYLLLKDKIIIISIQKQRINIHKQQIDSTFYFKTFKIRGLLSTSPQGKKYNAQALSAELYDVLIKPIEKEIAGKKRLIIIRDAELNYIPFEVLAKQKDDFLLKKYTISYAYSASLLMPSTTNKKQGSGLLGFAPFANNSFQQSLFRDKNLGQLPKSGEEIEKIGGDIYLENEATKKRFYENYRDKNIIHFATHAITDDADPLKSFIAFYPDSVDYKLFTNELYDLDLQNTNLVMLSACETGVGKLQKGEGVMSLARAFSYAGAKAVITTLWNAHDEASAYISERFYKYLKDGLKSDEALQKAKLDFLNSELALRYEHPYYWANFILIGPAESIDFGMNWWFWGLGMFFLLLLIFMVTKFRGKGISPKQAETRIG